MLFITKYFFSDRFILLNLVKPLSLVQICFKLLEKLELYNEALTASDLVNAQGVYFILRVHAGAFNR